MEAAPPRDLTPQVHAAVQETLGGLAKVYVAPRIPQDKLQGAAKKLFPLAQPGDRVLALVDFTMFGSNKDGVAIFGSYFTYANMGDADRRVYYGAIAGRPAHYGMKVVVDGVTLNLQDGALAAAFAAFLDRAATLHRFGA